MSLARTTGFVRIPVDSSFPDVIEDKQLIQCKNVIFTTLVG
jgi:hypothetical protein